jgi:hypothetical protein
MWARSKVSRPWLVLLTCTSLPVPQEAPPNRGSIPTFGTTVVVSSGLRGDVYLIPVDTDRLPRFKHLKPVGTIYTTTLDVPPTDFRQGFPGVTDRFEWFAIDYSGKFWIEQMGRYRFALTSDDGSQLYIDDRLIIDNDGIHPPSSCVASVELARGAHTIRVSYFQGPRYQVALILLVARPGDSWQLFDTTEFIPPSDSAASNISETDHHRKRVGRVEGGTCAQP